MGIDETRQFKRDRTQQLPRTIAVRQTRRVAVAILGGVFVGTGIVLLALPGPGIAVLAIGLTILSWEFAWAKRTLLAIKERVRKLRTRRTRRGSGPD
jgi:uncharacterized protein (TIGR02611 family)